MTPEFHREGYPGEGGGEVMLSLTLTQHRGVDALHFGADRLRQVGVQGEARGTAAAAGHWRGGRRHARRLPLLRCCLLSARCDYSRELPQLDDDLRLRLHGKGCMTPKEGGKSGLILPWQRGDRVEVTEASTPRPAL